MLKPGGEWAPRLGLIALVALVNVGVAFVPGRYQNAAWPLLALIALVGALLPGWFYFQVRPLVSDLLREPLGIGPGVWLNSAGHLLIAGLGLWQWHAERK